MQWINDQVSCTRMKSVGKHCGCVYVCGGLFVLMCVVGVHHILYPGGCWYLRGTRNQGGPPTSRSKPTPHNPCVYVCFGWMANLMGSTDI